MLMVQLQENVAYRVKLQQELSPLMTIFSQNLKKISTMSIFLPAVAIEI